MGTGFPSRQTRSVCAEIKRITNRGVHDLIYSDHDWEPHMKKPKIETEEAPPRRIIRADKAPTSGYSLVVDGHFKSHHDTVEAAEQTGMALKNQFQMLQVQVYDAETKTRSMIEWPVPA